jgi:hypothetical protein
VNGSYERIFFMAVYNVHLVLHGYVHCAGYLNKCEESVSNSNNKQFQELVRTAFGITYRMGHKLLHRNNFMPFMWHLSSCIQWDSSKSIHIARVMSYI